MLIVYADLGQRNIESPQIAESQELTALWQY